MGVRTTPGRLQSLSVSFQSHQARRRRLSAHERDGGTDGPLGQQPMKSMEGEPVDSHPRDGPASFCRVIACTTEASVAKDYHAGFGRDHIA